MKIQMTIPPDVYKIEHQFKPEDFAPGIWAGSEGLRLVVTKVDLENRIVTIELLKDEDL